MEFGTHEELMELAGRYRYLYGLRQMLLRMSQVQELRRMEVQPVVMGQLKLSLMYLTRFFRVGCYRIGSRSIEAFREIKKNYKEVISETISA